MTLKEILADKELALHKKKAELQKSDFSGVLLETVQKAANNGIDRLEVLVYEAIVKRDRNEEMFKQYINGWVLNHSVGMRYMKLLFCYNSDEAEYSQNKENYDKYLPEIFNKEDVEEYFWAITEAKNIEGSAVVRGSNILTPVLSMEIIDENTIKVKCAISPSNVIDSHKDVHIPGLWKKSLSETKYDLLLQEHEMEFNMVIADSITGDLKTYTEMISVKELLSTFQSKAVQDTLSRIKTEPSIDTQPKKQSNKELLEALNNLQNKL
jgi:hypothetical protein